MQAMHGLLVTGLYMHSDEHHITRYCHYHQHAAIYHMIMIWHNIIMV